jgi:hypothetical protein
MVLNEAKTASYTVFTRITAPDRVLLLGETISAIVSSLSPAIVTTNYGRVLSWGTVDAYNTIGIGQ